ncbi:translocation/assembly module TamB domain-containing protein, partial [Bombella apis]
AAHRLDPTIDFRADRNANGTLASLLVRGYASDPKIDFVSNPSRPRDEVLSILLFGTDRNSLSSTQLASLGLAIVQIGGGSAFDPMGKVRSTLGLDHLAIGGGNSVGKGAASVEAGKYVMKGVYVGAKEGLSGKGAQAQVKVDLTKRLQLNTTVGTGGQVTGFTTPENDPGSSVGLSYGIDY